MTTELLDKELETYHRELPQLKEQAGKFVLIQGDKVLSIWATYEDAIQQGYCVCGLTNPFLVKKIEMLSTSYTREFM